MNMLDQGCFADSKQSIDELAESGNLADVLTSYEIALLWATGFDEYKRLISEINLAARCDTRLVCRKWQDGQPVINSVDVASWIRQKDIDTEKLPAPFAQWLSSAKQKAMGVSNREEPALLKILAGVVESRYGKGSVADVKQQNSGILTCVLTDLELAGYAVTRKTLAKYARRLPPPSLPES